MGVISINPEEYEHRRARKASIIRLLLAHGADWKALEPGKQTQYRELLEKYPEQEEESVPSSSE